MSKRMLIDTSHPEETRVAVVSGNRLEEFDYESGARKQLKGNIYLAKVTRVEPSLQAAFVEYGGNRHGFLPFSEIHPDYYRIPIADREALIAQEANLKPEAAFDDAADTRNGEDAPAEAEAGDGAGANGTAEAGTPETPGPEAANGGGQNGKVEEVAVETSVDTIGGDDVDDAARRRARLMRHYKIQEVIKRRQVLLIQVTKEERGNKGAALTTYLSLAGRYCVLMPNTARGGGISRKISGSADRRRLKSVIEELDIPEGVGVIVRTAGSERSKPEIRRDYDYLLRLWSEIRETTLSSTAPALIYEEANLIKRAIRDLYRSDMEEILVEGDDGHKAAKAFMKSLMPSHARNVKPYKDPTVPLFQRYQVEGQIDAMHSPVVQLKSGGYIVINATEALVAIDVNSGKATRERHIEETAYKTNLEASDEIARQLRLRDLAGLIVIDFIDMEDSRHDRNVERRLKEAMRTDRARIQLGRISPFGLLEMSRQRLRPSLAETTTSVCPTCKGTGHIRTTDSAALHVLRVIEEDAVRRGGGEISITVPSGVAMHLLNLMRVRLVELEQRHGLAIRVDSDEKLTPPEHRLERLSRTAPVSGRDDAVADRSEPEADSEERAERTGRGESSVRAESDGERRRGRRRRRRGDDRPAPVREAAAPPPADHDNQDVEPPAERAAVPEVRAESTEEQGKRRRRRGKRGGRRRGRRDRDGTVTDASAAATDAASHSASAEASPVSQEAETPAVSESTEAEPAAESAPVAATEKKARPRRSRGGRNRGAAKSADAEGGSAPAASVGAAAAVTSPVDDAPSADAEAKPRRRRRGRQTPAKDTAAQPASPLVPAPTAPAHEPAGRPPVEAPIATGEQANTTGEQANTTGEPANVGGTAEDGGQPRRRGWWQRWG